MTSHTVASKVDVRPRCASSLASRQRRFACARVTIGSVDKAGIKKLIIKHRVSIALDLVLPNLNSSHCDILRCRGATSRVNYLKSVDAEDEERLYDVTSSFRSASTDIYIVDFKAETWVLVVTAERPYHRESGAHVRECAQR